MERQWLYEEIERQRERLTAIADHIFDHLEYDGEEYIASALLEGYLEEQGFAVERGAERLAYCLSGGLSTGAKRCENRPFV